jgi:hypothetical protein
MEGEMIAYDTIVSSASDGRGFLTRRLAAGAGVAVVERGLIEADAWKTGKRLLAGKRLMPR